jgi:FkbM family methyltransferase
MNERPSTEEQDFSQFGEQIYILEFFNKYPGLPHYCVDVGAHDGITGSNSRSLFLRGWAGLLIEPDPRTFCRLQALYKDRPDIRCIRCAISTFEGEAMMRFCKGPPGTPVDKQWEYGQVNTLKDQFADYFIREHNWEYEQAKVQLSTLATVLEKFRAPREIGFLSLDCEGEDMNIVTHFDFNKWQIALVSIECEDASRYLYQDTMGRYGYKYYAHTRSNTLFALRG